jgi:hypothetical protein
LPARRVERLPEVHLGWGGCSVCGLQQKELASDTSDTQRLGQVSDRQILRRITRRLRDGAGLMPEARNWRDHPRDAARPVPHRHALPALRESSDLAGKLLQQTDRLKGYRRGYLVGGMAGRKIDAIACITKPWSMIVILGIVMSRYRDWSRSLFSQQFTAAFRCYSLFSLAVSRCYLFDRPLQTEEICG